MQYFLYGVFFIYSLPLIGIIISFFYSGCFSKEVDIIYIVGAISGRYLKSLWHIFGLLLVPFVTALSIKIEKPGLKVGSPLHRKIPTGTIVLFIILSGLFVLSCIFYGIISSHEKDLQRFSQAIFDSYMDITTLYFKETLMYIAMTLGVSLKD